MPLTPLLLRDDCGSTARVLPGWGFNCYSFQAVVDGAPQELLWSDPEVLSGEARPSGSGIPLLFPFPGRIRGTRFTFQGRSYELEPQDALGNAIHGFVLDRAWDVVEQSDSHLVGRFQASRADPGLLQRWPADFCLTVAYQLEGNRLSSALRVENPDDRPLPWGLGTHAYFRLPLSVGGDRGRCVIRVPAGERFELADMLPTGQVLPAEGDYDLAAGLPFAEAQLDDVFTNLQTEGGTCTAEIADPDGGCKLQVSFDDAFPHCVVYNPPHREAICIEPYTCVPGTVGEGGRDAADALAVLPPGESVQLHVRIELV